MGRAQRVDAHALLACAAVPLASCCSSSKHASSALADASQVNSLARSQARRAIASRWLSSLKNARIALAIDPTSVGSKYTPASPTTSGNDPGATRDYRCAAGHRFDGRQTETLHERRQDKPIARL